MQKITIQNRKNQKIVVVLERPETGPEKLTSSSAGLAFVMHGLGGYKEQKIVRTMAESFSLYRYTVVTFDTTNTFGESDGSMDLATTTNYIEDLEDVINWAKNGTDANQSEWYQEPFCLAGHSLGGISTAHFAEKNCTLIKGLALMATVVSGKLSTEANPLRTEEWKRIGYEEKKSNSKPWLSAKLPWSHMEDRFKYDLLLEAEKLDMPVLMVVGSEDDLTPPDTEKILFEMLPGRKEFHLVEGAPHTFKETEHLSRLKEVFSAWIASL